MAIWQNLKQNSGLRADPLWRRFVTRWSLISLLLIGLVCHFSYDFFQFDEYYQITEFVSYKLGKTPEAQMAWEYHAQLRPWLQPAIYYVAARGLIGLGIENPFTLAEVFRLMSGLCAWMALVSLMLTANVLFGDDHRRRPAVVLLAGLFLLPYLAARTSSESLSGDMFSIGFSTLLLGSVAVDRQRRIVPALAALLAGICFGLAFEFRYQIAFAVLGVVAWIFYFSGESRGRTLGKLALLSCGVFLAVAVGTAADCWGYGHWVLAPWNYFHTNIILGIANRFGTSPVWWYLAGVNSSPMAPLTLLWTIAMLVTWVRHPKHIVSWATLSFCIVHSLVGHKESRFLFPIAQVATFAFILGLAPRPGELHQPKWLRWLWQQRRSRWAMALYGLNFIGLAGMGFSAKQPGVLIQKLIYDRYPHDCRAYILGRETKSPYTNVGFDMYFYRPPGFQLMRLDGYDELSWLLRVGPPKFLLITDHVRKEPEQDLIVPQAELVYRTYPPWVENYNYFNWQQRSRRYSMYEVDSRKQTDADPLRQSMVRRDVSRSDDAVR
jgi:phosphatidylinositol glycan class B